MSIRPKDGDFVVVQNQWATEVRQVIKVSASIYYYQPTWRTKQSRARLDEILFSGTEETAKRLCEQLRSSDAQCDNERNKAVERRRKRDAEFIERAKAIPPAERGGGQ